MNHATSVRNRKHALRMVQELDAFPKVPESYQETTATGGGGMLLASINLNMLVHLILQLKIFDIFISCWQPVRQ